MDEELRYDDENRRELGIIDQIRHDVIGLVWSEDNNVEYAKYLERVMRNLTTLEKVFGSN